MRQCHSFQWWLKKQNKKVYVLHDVKNDIQRRRRSLRGCKQTNNANDIKKTWCHCTKYHHHHQISLSSYHRHHHVVQNVMCERIKVIWNIWKTPCLVCVLLIWLTGLFVCHCYSRVRFHGICITASPLFVWIDCKEKDSLCKDSLHTWAF